MWRASLAVTLAVLGVATAIAALVVRMADGPVTAVALAGIAVTVLAGAIGWPLTSRRFASWGYRFTGTALELRHGKIWRFIVGVPYHRIQQVDVEQGPLQRRFGLVSLTLRTASASSGSTIPGIDTDVATELRSRLLQLAGQDDGA